MKMIHKVAVNTLIVAMFLGLGGCSDMTTQEKNTANGGGVGAVGGAAVGGVVGHEISK